MSVCVCAHVRACVCVCLYNNLKFIHIVVYGSSSDELIYVFSQFTAIQTIRSYNSTLVQARKVIFSMIFSKNYQAQMRLRFPENV